MPDMQKNVTPGKRKRCPNYSPEFIAASCEPGINRLSISLSEILQNLEPVKFWLLYATAG